jgi:hypothetical protein
MKGTWDLKQLVSNPRALVLRATEGLDRGGSRVNFFLLRKNHLCKSFPRCAQMIFT